MRIVPSLLLSLAALLAASGVHAARAVPIQNYEDLPVSSADGKPLTAEQVRKAIISGAATRQWIASVQPGNIVRLTYSPRSHSAVVDVVYSAKSYSIRYADSTNLNYGQEGSKGVIHPNYNKWINNLRQAIEVALRSA
jgi:hypothetical protein